MTSSSPSGQGADYAATASEAYRAALRVIDPPLEVPGFELLMLWHERVHRDPAHRWLREHIARSVGSHEAPSP